MLSAGPRKTASGQSGRRQDEHRGGSSLQEQRQADQSLCLTGLTERLNQRMSATSLLQSVLFHAARQRRQPAQQTAQTKTSWPTLFGVHAPPIPRSHKTITQHTAKNKPNRRNGPAKTELAGCHSDFIAATVVALPVRRLASRAFGQETQIESGEDEIC